MLSARYEYAINFKLLDSILRYNIMINFKVIQVEDFNYKSFNDDVDHFICLFAIKIL